jgi:hypothetical protein
VTSALTNEHRVFKACLTQMEQVSDDVTRQGCRKVGAWGALPPQCLAKQLTLSQPGGPATVLRAPQNFQTLRRPCT